MLAVAAAFQNRGFGYGDVITIVDTGSYEGQTIMLAGLLIGATVTALDYSLKTGERILAPTRAVRLTTRNVPPPSFF